MGTKITSKEVKRRLKRIANERGYEYVYEAPHYEDEYGEVVQASECYYSDCDGRPSCMVGVLLNEVEPTAYRKLHQYEWDGHYEPRCVAVTELYGNSVVEEVDLAEIFEPDALKVLQRAQAVQDRGETWGEAVKAVRNLD